MKIIAFILAGTVAVIMNAHAQSSSSATNVISKSPGSEQSTESTDDASSDSSASKPVYGLSDIADQVGELRRVVDETLPVLTAATEGSATATNAPSGGGLAEVLGNILRGNTNQTGSTTGGTNVWGNILRGVLGTNATAGAEASATLQDLAVLRDQLQSLKPVLDRLDSGALSKGNDDLTPTGRE